MSDPVYLSSGLQQIDVLMMLPGVRLSTIELQMINRESHFTSLLEPEPTRNKCRGQIHLARNFELTNSDFGAVSLYCNIPFLGLVHHGPIGPMFLTK